MSANRLLPLTTADDIAKSRSWTQHLFSDPEHLPIAFMYAGKHVTGIPNAWHPTSQTRRIDTNLIETVYTGTDHETGLEVSVECLQYQDFPVVEWVAWFSNRGTTKTPVLQDILALDGVFAGSSPTVYHCNGDFYSEDGYTPEHTALRMGETLALAPHGGRPCDQAFPYFRAQFQGSGLTIALGWPGQWSARFEGLADGIRIQAGQEKTHLYLQPGERIRTPRMTVLAWVGDSARAVNLWRRWYLAHILPKPHGQPLGPLLACAGTDEGEEFTNATEENQIRYMEKFRQIGLDFDVWWIDAGWYPCTNDEGKRTWVLIGTWWPDQARFPHGLRPVSRYAEADGADLLLWFEPERVTRGSQLDVEHPEWLLTTRHSSEDAYRLLNLGNPACRHWLTEHISKLIEENGIKIYRQDFNFEPLRYWRDQEAEDRQGINENLHIQGYLQFWDDLLLQHPGLWIDSCASGGRRNDLETMRRSVPLHYSDYGYGDHPVKVAFHHTLYSWLPYFKDTTLDDAAERRFNQQLDPFSVHCGMAPMLMPAVDIRRDDYDYSLCKTMIALWRRASQLLLYGDYYPLTPFSRSAETWVVWQFDRPETGEGLIQGIRHAKCPTEAITVSPAIYSPQATYVLENLETDEKVEVSAADLLQHGFTLKLPKRGAGIWFYYVRE